mgnify:FL=1
MTHTTPMQFADALGCLKRVRTLLVLLIVLCLLGQLGGFAYLNFLSPGDAPAQIDAVEPAVPSADGVEADATEAIAEAPAVADVDDAAGELVAEPAAPAIASEVASRDALHQSIFWGLAITKMLALILAMVLLMTTMFATKVSLVGQIGATAGFFSAFYCSMLLVVLLVPWQQMNSAVACGATYNFGQWLEQARVVCPRWGSAGSDAGATVLYYIRFVAYPGLTMVATLIAGARFSAGYRPIRLNQKMAATMGGAGVVRDTTDSSNIQL